MVIVYFQNHAITLTYDEEHQLGMAKCVGFLSSEEFREATIMSVRMMEKFKPLRWLADNRRMRAIRQADQEWFAAYTLPRLQAGSIRRSATVVSEDIFNKMAVEQFLKRADHLGDIVMKEFDNIEEALAWVKEPISFRAQG